MGRTTEFLAVGEISDSRSSSRPPLRTLAVDDSDASDIEDLVVHRGRSRRRQRRAQLLRAKIRALRHHSRMYAGCLRILGFFISGFLFALIMLPLWSFEPNDHFDDAFSHFDTTSDVSPDDPRYPTEFMKSVLPIRCHSHNDYWRRRPVWSALASGCISIEADVWGAEDELFVGHSTREITTERTLNRIYLAPLLELLDFMNRGRTTGSLLRGVFYRKPEQSLILIIDLKQPEIWPLLHKQLQPLRERDYLTYWNGSERIERPLTIVASGSTPFDQLISNTTYRDVFYDAPLESLGELKQLSWPPRETPEDVAYSKYNISNSYYASSSLSRAVGSLRGFALTESQLELMRHQVREARYRGLVPRYWGTPSWPRGLRDEIWSVLVQADVGVINVDDLRAARKGTWGSWPQRIHRMTLGLGA